MTSYFSSKTCRLYVSIFANISVVEYILAKQNPAYSIKIGQFKRNLKDCLLNLQNMFDSRGDRALTAWTTTQLVPRGWVGQIGRYS